MKITLIVFIILTGCVHTLPTGDCPSWKDAAFPGIVQEAKKLGAAALLITTCGKTILTYGDTAKPYKVHSIRKSLMNSLYGVYTDREIIDINATLAELGIDDKATLSAVEKQATIRDLLRSRSGVYLEAGGEISEMEESRPARGSHEPGSFFYYNNWDFNVLGTVFTKVTKQDIFQAFQREIAQKIGMLDFSIGDTNLKYEKQSLHPVYQFRMSARDLNRYGQLYLSKGLWGDKRILSEKWVTESTKLTGTGPENNGTKSGFGYLWWGVTKKRFDLHEGIIVASGLGTQRLYIIPGLKTVVVFLKDTDNFDSLHPERTVIGTKLHDQFLSQILRANF